MPKVMMYGLAACAVSAGALAGAMPAEAMSNCASVGNYHLALGNFYLSYGLSGQAAREFGIAEGIFDSCNS